MELTYKEKTDIEKDTLKEIVSGVFNVDISLKDRRRNSVDARRIYSKVLRERGYTFESIGDSLDRDHATIIHYIGSVDTILAYDKGLRDKYIACKNVFLEGRAPLMIERMKKDADLYVTVIRLNDELQEIIKEKKEILTKFVHYIDKYEKETGNYPSVNFLKKRVIPLFDIK
jgi:hypothetical protein